MKKIFVLSNDRNKYSKFLKKISPHFLESSIINKKNIKNNLFFTKYDVVIFNEISLEISKFLKKKKIIQICINKKETFNDNYIDLFIDPFFIDSITKIKPRKSELLESINIINFLRWDSKFWGYKIGYLATDRLTENIIYRVNREIKKKSYKLIQFLCNSYDPKSIQIAEKNNFSFKDVRLTFEKKIRNIKKISTKKKYNFSIAKINDFEEIGSIIESNYKDSRYYFDENFDRKKLVTFYLDWLKKSIRGKFDNRCYILKKVDKILAFSTIRFDKDYKNSCSIGLFAVDDKFRGKKFSQLILKKIEKSLMIKRIEKINVITQARNCSAIRAYENFGFKLCRTQIWYHRWI